MSYINSWLKNITAHIDTDKFLSRLKITPLDITTVTSINIIKPTILCEITGEIIEKNSHIETLINNVNLLWERNEL